MGGQPGGAPAELLQEGAGGGAWKQPVGECCSLQLIDALETASISLSLLLSSARSPLGQRSQPGAEVRKSQREDKNVHMRDAQASL